MIIEQKVREHLLGRIEGIEEIRMEVPENPPEKYILIQKTGNRPGSGVENPVVAVQSICRTSKYDAAVLNESVKAAMKDFAEGKRNVFGCSLNTDYDFTNSRTKEYRYQAVFQFQIMN